jgi:hypothetical protein
MTTPLPLLCHYWEQSIQVSVLGSYRTAVVQQLQEQLKENNLAILIPPSPPLELLSPLELSMLPLLLTGNNASEDQKITQPHTNTPELDESLPPSSSPTNPITPIDENVMTTSCKQSHHRANSTLKAL